MSLSKFVEAVVLHKQPWRRAADTHGVDPVAGANALRKTQIKVAGIYALRDCATNRVRYVGSSAHCFHRWKAHQKVGGHVGSTSPRWAAWLRELSNQGLCIEGLILQVLEDGANVKAAEQRWIKHYRALGQADLNENLV